MVQVLSLPVLLMLTGADLDQRPFRTHDIIAISVYFIKTWNQYQHRATSHFEPQ